jgi:endo-1,4-beta-mannosidase
LSYSYYPQPAEKGVNVCLHLSDCGCSTISYLTELEVKGVRTDWVVADDSSMRDYSQRLQDSNINLLAIVNMSTFGDQISLKEWNETVTYIVTSEGFNNTDTIEVGNEPNNDEYYIPPETYYEMLKSAYAIIKNYTDIPVVFAGVSPNVPGWQNYLNAVFAYDNIQDYFDYMGIHLYEDMETNLETLQFVKNLTDKPIWITETGKPSMNNDEAAQAEYVSSVYETFEPLVDEIFIYELYDNSGLDPDWCNYFGLLTVNGTQKEAYRVVCDINR